MSAFGRLIGKQLRAFGLLDSDNQPLGGVVVVQQATVTLTDAQMRAANDPFEIVPAQGDGKLINFITAVAILDVTAGAYTNVANVELTFFENVWPVSLTYRENTFGFLADVDGVKLIQFGPLLPISGGEAGVGGSVMTGTYGRQNRPLTLNFANGGPLLDGHADNTMKVTTLYSVMDL